MKSIIENYVSLIIYVIFIFTFIAFSTVQMQLIQARQIHTAVINQVQSSHYQVDIDAINNKIRNDINNQWQIRLVDNGTNNPIVELDYCISMPVFNIETTGVIQGYTR